MNRFPTLLQREWMQHRRGWLVLMVLPLLIFAGAGLFGHLHIDLGDNGVVELPEPLLVAAGTIAGTGLLSLALAWAASMIQAPGLARRDVQDRSIEFWLSLPVSHVQSLAATLLMHLLLVPWLALVVGACGGLIVALLLLVKIYGLAAWFSLPWPTLLVAGLALGLRVMFGLALATLWLSPLILGTMAASAWLKRWGLPIVVGTLAVGGLWLDKLYGWPVVWDTLQLLSRNASRALIATDRGASGSGLTLRRPDQIVDALHAAPGWALHDAARALAAAASPAMLAALVVAALAFGALWLRRQRGA